MAASSDAGPLIWLAKCNILHLLKKLYPQVLIPEAVHEEAISRGLEKGFEDAKIIKKALEEEWIKIHPTSTQFTDKVEAVEKRLDIELGSGEREAIALAIEKKIPTFLTNDEDAYQLAKILGLEPKGVLYLLLKGVKEQHHNKEKVKESLSKMLEEGFWLSPTIIHKFHEALARL